MPGMHNFHLMVVLVALALAAYEAWRIHLGLEAMRWLFTADDSLPGTPIDAIVKRRSTEVNRRAQALAF